MSSLKIELISQSDIPVVVAFLREFFYRDEPVNKSVGLVYTEELKEFSLQSVSDNCSFKAVDADGKIIGVYINGITRKPTSSGPAASIAETIKSEPFKKIVKLFEHIDTQFSLFDLYPNIDKYLDAKIISVDQKYRGRGIAGKLGERTHEYMRANDISTISMMCTSHYSARVCEKLGYRKVYTLKYADYVVDGQTPIVPEEPHKAVQIYVKEFNS